MTSSSTSKKHSFSAFCRYSFMAIGCIWPEPGAEVIVLTLSGRDAEKPASVMRRRAAARSYLLSKEGLPHEGWPGATVPFGIAISPPSSVFSSSRLTHRLAAWRTHLSSQGEPAAKENCHGHTCGWSLA